MCGKPTRVPGVMTEHSYSLPGLTAIPHAPRPGWPGWASAAERLHLLQSLPPVVALSSSLPGEAGLAPEGGAAPGLLIFTPRHLPEVHVLYPSVCKTTLSSFLSVLDPGGQAVRQVHPSTPPRAARVRRAVLFLR